jgi:hypothetical protein
MEDRVTLNLNEEEQQAVAALQQEMGLQNPEEVVHLLLRQAAQRALVVCPSCGHSARKTAQDEASCVSCMSVLQLSDGIWEVISLQ